MKENVKNAVENYQCTGCMVGGDVSCFKGNSKGGVGCGKHYAGTGVLGGVGKIFLGLPKGFNRLGKDVELQPIIFDKFEDSDWEYNMWNVPVWKHLNEEGHTLVRGMMPRRNEPFLHIYLENCIDKINCLEISKDDVKGMD